MEAELGRLGGVEDDMSVDAESAFLTDPQEAKRFVERTGVDSLAVAIGTAHGLYTKTPKIDFQRLGEIREVVDVPRFYMAQAMFLTNTSAARSSLAFAKLTSLLN